MIGIYKITNPKGKVYIGQAINIERRFKTYFKLQCKSQIKLYRSFNKYGVKNHIFEILEECDENQLNNKERYYQDLYDVIGKNGLNLKLTKIEDKSGKLSKESRLKMSNSHKGKVLSEKHKLNLKISSLGKKNSKESIIKMRLKAIGRIHSNETKIKISLNNSSSKKVICLKTCQIWNSAKECFNNVNDIKVNYNTFTTYLRGGLKNKTNYEYFNNNDNLEDCIKKYKENENKSNNY